MGSEFQSVEGTRSPPAVAARLATGAAVESEILRSFGRLRGAVEFQWLRLLSKFLVWLHAERTIPNPLILRNPNVALEGAALVRVADELGWPSDTAAWQRMFLWILNRQAAFPVIAIQLCADLFTVWQNMWGDHPNLVSAQVIAVSEQWLIDLEKVRASSDEGQADPTRWSNLTGDAKGLLRSTLRRLLFRSGCSYPDFARRALDRIIGFEHRSGDLLDLFRLFSHSRRNLSRTAGRTPARRIDTRASEGQDRER